MIASEDYWVPRDNADSFAVLRNAGYWLPTWSPSGSRRLKQLEIRMGKKDQEARVIFEAIESLIGPDSPDRRLRIGFEAATN